MYFIPRCRECLPEEWFCEDCDVLHHKKQPLHNRECLIRGFFEPIPPTTHVIRGEGRYNTQEQGIFSKNFYFAVHMCLQLLTGNMNNKWSSFFLPACILPTVRVSNCVCDGTTFTVLPGKPVILITINGKNNSLFKFLFQDDIQKSNHISRYWGCYKMCTKHVFFLSCSKGVMTCISHCMHVKRASSCGPLT